MMGFNKWICCIISLFSHSVKSKQKRALYGIKHRNKIQFMILKKTLVTLLFMALLVKHGSAQDKITMDPNTTYQTVDGWGASLSWWANIMGGHPDDKVDILVDWIVSPSHLNMNLFRFNIGAGDHPDHHHMRADGGAMPSYKLSADADYDWSQDDNQRDILQRLLARRSQLMGTNDIKLVAFSTSPPWWMTKSGCSAGATTQSTNNLKEDMYDDFADYLTDVVQYYHDSLAITFDYIEPMNEPDGGWWVAEGNQEGCYFSVDKQQKLLIEVYAALERKEMLSYCKLAGSDWNNMNNGVAALNSYVSGGQVMDKLSHIDCHSYFGNNTARQQLNTLAKQYNKTLWQSESGPLNVGNSPSFQVMHMAQRIITDMRLMKPDAWIDWQIVTNGSAQWGLVDGKYANNLERCTKFPSFYIRSQYSRFIKPAYTIINSNRDNTLAALSPERDEVVLVICNTDTSGAAHNYDIDLRFFEVGGGIPYQYLSTVDGEYKTKRSFVSIKDKVINYTAPLQSVTTFVIPITGTLDQPEIVSDVLADFEQGRGLFTDVSLHSSCVGTYPNDTAPHPTWHILYDSIGNNPLRTINTSNNAYIVEQENSDWWGNFLNFRLANEGEGIAIYDNKRFLHVYHYRETLEDGWSIYINSEVNCSNEGNKRRIDGNNTAINQWEDLVFDLDYLQQANATLDLFTFCLNTDYTSPKSHPMSVFAFDEIVLNNSSTPRHLMSQCCPENELPALDVKYRYHKHQLTLWTENDHWIDDVKLYNISGQCIVSSLVNSTSFSCTIEEAGLYIASINHSTYRKKLLLY